jgi:L-fucose isomerase-like protein
MRIQPVFFASPVYYERGQFLTDSGVLLAEIHKLVSVGNELLAPVFITDQAEVDAFPALNPGTVPLLVNLSGATQRWVLQLAKAAKQSLLWWYFPGDGLFDEAVEATIRSIASRNALPAIMDCWAHLKNRDVPVERVYDAKSMQEQLQMMNIMKEITNTRLLIIGYTQQWVVSTSVDERWLEDRFGIQSVHIGLEELFAEYGDIPRDAAAVRHFAEEYMAAATACVEPAVEQIEDAYRLYLALKKLMERYRANALAISCFSLVKQLKVTSCLALSLLNDEPGVVAACEGDMDAAISMVVGKVVSGLPVFMGNPVYHIDDTLDIVHCTAPRRLGGDQAAKFTVRSHHETGLSMAQRIELPPIGKATLFRIGNEFSEATLFTADFIDNPDEDTCRTQFRFRIDSSERRIEQSLGCHHMVLFGDYEEQIRAVLEGPLGIAIR